MVSEFKPVQDSTSVGLSYMSTSDVCGRTVSYLYLKKNLLRSGSVILGQSTVKFVLVVFVKWIWVYCATILQCLYNYINLTNQTAQKARISTFF